MNENDFIPSRTIQPPFARTAVRLVTPLSGALARRKQRTAMRLTAAMFALTALIELSSGIIASVPPMRRPLLGGAGIMIMLTMLQIYNLRRLPID